MIYTENGSTMIESMYAFPFSFVLLINIVFLLLPLVDATHSDKYWIFNVIISIVVIIANISNLIISLIIGDIIKDKSFINCEKNASIILDEHSCWFNDAPINEITVTSKLIIPLDDGTSFYFNDHEYVIGHDECNDKVSNKFMIPSGTFYVKNDTHWISDVMYMYLKTNMTGTLPIGTLFTYDDVNMVLLMDKKVTI